MLLVKWGLKKRKKRKLAVYFHLQHEWKYRHTRRVLHGFGNFWSGRGNKEGRERVRERERE